MKHHQIRREDDRVIFGATDSILGWGVFAVLLVLMGGSLLWWWPTPPEQLYAPWQRDNWPVVEALGYGILWALFAGLLVVTGGYLSDRNRRHELTFDPVGRLCEIDEWWRGHRISAAIPFGWFSSFEAHRPVDRRDIWQLGVVLANGSYWRLDRDTERDELQHTAEQLNEQMALGKRDGGPDRPKLPESIELRREDGELQLRWEYRERLSVQVLTLAATVVFSLAVVAPVALVFEGAFGWLAGALVAASVLFAVPLFASWSPRAGLPFVIGWMGVVVASVAVVGAHWLLFPIASAGLAIFANSAAAIASGLRRTPTHSIRIDGAGRIYEDGQLLEDDDAPAVADQFEGAVVDLTEVRPPQMRLVKPGGGEQNRSRHLNLEHPEDVAIGEPVELQMPGMSLFELVVVSLIVDDEIARHHQGQ